MNYLRLTKIHENCVSYSPHVIVPISIPNLLSQSVFGFIFLSIAQAAVICQIVHFKRTSLLKSVIYSFNLDWCVSRTMPILTFICWQWLVWNNDNGNNKAGWRTSSGFHLLMELPALVSWHFWVICFLSCLSRSLGYWCFIAKQEGRQLSDLPIIQPVIIKECSVFVFQCLYTLVRVSIVMTVLCVTVNNMFTYFSQAWRKFLERFFIFKWKAFFLSQLPGEQKTFSRAHARGAIVCCCCVCRQ